jgi:hypothetical protein
MGSIPIVHVHGLLGRVSVSDVDSEETARAYEGEVNENILRICARQIRIVHEEVTGSTQFGDARKLLREAEIIAFLGFGYDRTNLQRLTVRRLLLDRRMRGDGLEVYGTAFGKGEAERAWIHSYFFKKIQLGGPSEEIRGFLLDNPILIQLPDMRDDVQ